ncbi:MAG: ORF6N domain-containing protein [Bacteroidaceae bacterium]|nr:ORF6N domain-containing protein [Bacteroidaceae bacterium]
MTDLQLIQSKIFEIRGQRVMLDRDLAVMYGVETKVLNQAVKRNLKRFAGDDFMFHLTKDETQQSISRSQIVTFETPLNTGNLNGTAHLRSQNVTTNKRGGSRYLPYAFTELGVAMLSSVLKSETAIYVNREIMRAFVEFRHMATSLVLPDSGADITQLRKDFEELKLDIEDILHNQNDINESTRMQLDNITMALAELQAKEPRQRPRRRIGFIQDDDNQK